MSETFSDRADNGVGTPTCRHMSFLYSVLRFASQLSFLCPVSDSHIKSVCNYLSVLLQSNQKR